MSLVFFLEKIFTNIKDKEIKYDKMSNNYCSTFVNTCWNVSNQSQMGFHLNEQDLRNTSVEVHPLNSC